MPSVARRRVRTHSSPRCSWPALLCRISARVPTPTDQAVPEVCELQPRHADAVRAGCGAEVDCDDGRGVGLEPDGEAGRRPRTARARRGPSGDCGAALRPTRRSRTRCARSGNVWFVPGIRGIYSRRHTYAFKSILAGSLAFYSQFLGYIHSFSFSCMQLRRIQKAQHSMVHTF